MCDTYLTARSLILCDEPVCAYEVIAEGLWEARVCAIALETDMPQGYSTRYKSHPKCDVYLLKGKYI